MLDDARQRVKDLGPGACPRCTAHASHSQSLALRGPTHITKDAPTHEQDHATSLKRCPHMKGVCLRCLGGDDKHGAKHCKVLPLQFQAHQEHGGCKACTLQIHGEPTTHSAEQVTPLTCDAVGKNFTKEYCLCLYRLGDLNLVLQHAGRGDLIFKTQLSTGTPTTKQVQDFVRFLHQPIFQGAVLSVGLLLVLYGCRRRAFGIGPATSHLTEDMLKCILRKGQDWESDKVFDSLGQQK